MGQIQERRKKENKSYKNISRFNGGAQNSTYSHSLILFKRKNNKPIRKILFSPSPCFICFFVTTFLLLYFFLSFFNPHIKSLSFFAITTKSSKEKKLKKKRKNLKRKSITNQ